MAGRNESERVADLDRNRWPECVGIRTTNDVIFDAAEHKARYSISYADCFVLVSALRHNGIVVTGDPEFKKMEHLVEVLWV
jgi:predicted nucleic acid-binding protein